MTLLSNFMRRFRRDERGLAAVEFALIVPIMLVSLIGAVQVSNDMLADRKATQTASTLADLVSQETSVNTADITDVFNSATPIMYPIATGSMGMRLTSIVADSKGVTTVDWSQSRNMTANKSGAAIAVPANLISPGGSIILAEVQIYYGSDLGSIISGVNATRSSTAIDTTLANGVQIAEQFYLRPRRSVSVTWSNN